MVPYIFSAHLSKAGKPADRKNKPWFLKKLPVSGRPLFLIKRNMITILDFQAAILHRRRQIGAGNLEICRDLPLSPECLIEGCPV